MTEKNTLCSPVPFDEAPTHTKPTWQRPTLVRIAMKQTLQGSIDQEGDMEIDVY